MINQIVIGIEKSNSSSEGDQKQKMQYSVTNVPCFDICYENIFLNGKKSRYDVKVKMVEENIHLLINIFGYKAKDCNKVTMINNQSYFK